jgi:hypothetical protein
VPLFSSCFLLPGILPAAVLMTLVNTVAEALALAPTTRGLLNVPQVPHVTHDTPKQKM